MTRPRDSGCQSCHLCKTWGFDARTLVLHLRDQHNFYDHQLARQSGVDLERD